MTNGAQWTDQTKIVDLDSDTSVTTEVSPNQIIFSSSGVERAHLDVSGFDLTVDIQMGGNDIIGDTVASGTLQLTTTSNATKGKILFGSESVYDEVNDRIGIGDTAPTQPLVVTDNSEFITEMPSFAGIRAFRYRASATGGINWLSHRGRGTVTVPLVVQDGDVLGRFFFRGYSANAGDFVESGWFGLEVDGTPDSGADPTDMPGRFVFATTPDGAGTAIERMRLDRDGNFLIGTTTPPTGTMGKVLIVGDNAGNPTMGANTAGFYGSDVAGTVEAFAIDEADNQVQLTPHPPDFLDTLPVDDAHRFPWVHRTSNRYLGKQITVDMEKLAYLVEQSTGEQLIYIEDTAEVLDWDENQALVKQKIDDKRAWANKEIAILNKELETETDLSRIQELTSSRDGLIMNKPEVYNKKPIPTWIANRIGQN